MSARHDDTRLASKELRVNSTNLLQPPLVSLSPLPHSRGSGARLFTERMGGALLSLVADDDLGARLLEEPMHEVMLSLGALLSSSSAA
jgi:hypothetical protein